MRITANILLNSLYNIAEECKKQEKTEATLPRINIFSNNPIRKLTQLPCWAMAIILTLVLEYLMNFEGEMEQGIVDAPSALNTGTQLLQIALIRDRCKKNYPVY